MSSLHLVFYVSRSVATPSQVEDIVAVSRSNNARRGMTGALLFSGGFFAQVLEGPHTGVAALMALLSQDSRHTGVTLLLDSAIEARRFAGWSLAYIDMPGVDDLLAHLLGAEMPAHRAQRLIDMLFVEPPALAAGGDTAQASNSGALNS